QFETFTKKVQLVYIKQKWVNFHDDITAQVPFYHSFKDKRNLNDYPVINKKMIANEPKMFYNRKYELNKLVPVRTSGSYGTPLTYYLTPAKKKRQQAEVIFFGRKCG